MLRLYLTDEQVPLLANAIREAIASKNKEFWRKTDRGYGDEAEELNNECEMLGAILEVLE